MVALVGELAAMKSRHKACPYIAVWRIATPSPVGRCPSRPGTVGTIIIPAQFKKEFKHILAELGIHRGTLFPDLDGQARYAAWRLLKSDPLAVFPKYHGGSWPPPFLFRK